ncbi:MAG: polysaccharide biosynthesis C-terminal domain-containing protein, partial [Chloroflexales bacterium]|nr:polysaccharide biosynthesis C-terminal domain-containing protein [Chloroflexales bacterium]
MRFWLFISALLLLLLLAPLAALLWRRFYREGEDNAARRVFKNSAVPLALRVLVRALDLVFAVVAYGYLLPSDFGRYDFAALLVVQYLGTISEFGLGVLLTREVARDVSAAPRLFGTTLALRLLLALAAVPAAALVIGTYTLLAVFGVGEAITPLGQQAIWVLLLTLLPAAYSGAATALYNANERMEVPALVELVTAALSMLARIAVLALGFGILGIAWAAVGVSCVTALIYGVLQSRAFFRPTLRWDTSLIRGLVPLALPLMLNNLLNAVFFRFDTFLLKAFGGSGDLLVAQYNLAYKVLGIAMILPPVVTFAVFPLLARRADGGRAALLEAQNRTLWALLLLAFPLAAGLSVLAPDLVRLFIGRSDRPQDFLPVSADALAILAWFLPLSFANGLLQYVLIAINQQRAITRAFVIGALFNLAVNLLTIPFFGLYAASVVTILSEVVLFAVFAPLLRREGLAPPLLRLAWRPALAALAMAA